MESASKEIRQQSILLKKTMIINVLQNDITRLENQKRNITSQIVELEKILSRREETALTIDDPTQRSQFECLVTNMEQKIQDKNAELTVVEKSMEDKIRQLTETVEDDTSSTSRKDTRIIEVDQASTPSTLSSKGDPQVSSKEEIVGGENQQSIHIGSNVDPTVPESN